MKVSIFMTINQKSSDVYLKDSNIEANCIDKRVGNRIRLRRRLLGYSQEKLALALGLSFQQVQKYEKGSNRVGASRLYDIAQILQVPINFFFDEVLNRIYIEEEISSSHLISSATAQDIHEILDDTITNISAPNGGNIFDLMNSKETVSLLKAYYNIQESEVRQKLLHLMRVMCSNNKPE